MLLGRLAQLEVINGGVSPGAGVALVISLFQAGLLGCLLGGFGLGGGVFALGLGAQILFGLRLKGQAFLFALSALSLASI